MNTDQCEFGSKSEDVERCQEEATTRIGGVKLCREHGSRTPKEVTEEGLPASRCSLRAVVISTLGGVAAISEDLYTDAMEEIASKAGRECDGDLWQEVGLILESLPCPID